MSTTSQLREWPKWAERALQGVAFWIGHRRCLYRDYPLAEGALVAEICNLVHASLPHNLALLCEVQYRSFLQGELKSNVLTERARIDLVVSERLGRNEVNPVPSFAIEVKRSSAPKNQVDADLRRLAVLRTEHPHIRTFMFLVAEAKRPDRFVSEKGSSRLGRHEIPNSNGHFRVRRTWKAAHAFSTTETAQYACLIEVYGPSKRGRRLRKSR